MRRVLGELSPESCLILKAQELQVIVRPADGFSVWAYFPINRRRMVVRQLAADGILLRPTTRVLLLISEKHILQQSTQLTDANLRDHLGHVLLYLRHPRASNGCGDALREWEASCR
ncbi:hypothetical protein SBA1_1480027 [Candidatus Sulfotelmatobacter kueseliae]|uniref:Uncharacterized protein n=1 Tax=Candidatus Sulfotelmatobacter kueseliae TaxID=2042962 RepID=A0A2U3K8I2_9BACT|nr:hypothetical protein SBA1_1480027 [Candidatus Sulfotelmatobacter kueseliae]